ncbi:uncharacterized protein LOC114250773 [Bombyx mandarina]|uniref:Uncharacterized protein LOC114250773 n=1 Tax=Bombyx mandarina TaxID=7092 RepID=A0A6J2KK85_BOMMA|nr:uncharacterized protein LOC114250773 [Bombyx mandarina]
MDINEDIIREEVSSFVSSLQRLLPKKKEIIVIQPQKVRLTRLNDVHYEAKNVFPKCFIGAKLVVLRDVLDKVKLIQQYNYGKPKDSYRTFGHLIHQETEPKHVDDGLVIDSAGSATATYKEVIEGSYEMRLTSRIKDLVSSETEIVFDKENEKSVGTVSCTMRDVDPTSLKFITQWMYKVHSDVYVGTEVGIRPLAFPAAPDYSLSVRYEKPSFALSSTISKIGFQACLYKKFAPDLAIASILSEDGRGVPVSVGLALHKNFGSDTDLKVFVDSQRCGGFTLQKDVHFRENRETRVLRIIASTLIDKQRRVRFGFGFNLDF